MSLSIFSNVRQLSQTRSLSLILTDWMLMKNLNSLRLLKMSVWRSPPEFNTPLLKKTNANLQQKSHTALFLHFKGFVSLKERISGRNQRHQVTSIQKTEAMRAVAGRRDWKPWLGKFLFGHKQPVLYSMQMEHISTGEKCLFLTLKLHWLHLSHRPAGCLWATTTRSSYQLWRPRFQTWQCRAETAGRPVKWKQDGVTHR